MNNYLHDQFSLYNMRYPKSGWRTALHNTLVLDQHTNTINDAQHVFRISVQDFFYQNTQNIYDDSYIVKYPIIDANTQRMEAFHLEYGCDVHDFEKLLLLPTIQLLYLNEFRGLFGSQGCAHNRKVLLDACKTQIYESFYENTITLDNCIEYISKFYERQLNDKITFEFLSHVATDRVLWHYLYKNSWLTPRLKVILTQYLSVIDEKNQYYDRCGINNSNDVYSLRNLYKFNAWLVYNLEFMWFIDDIILGHFNAILDINKKTYILTDNRVVVEF